MIQTVSKDPKRWIVLGILSLSLFIAAIDNTVLNLALPSISTDIGASTSGLQWITSSYILVFASLLLTTGVIGDRYGRKLILQAGTLLFGIGSLAAALSTSTGMLIACRAFLGLAAAMIMPATLSILTDTFRDPRERAKAIAIWSAVFSLGASIGPVIGGYLLEYFDWSAVFYINVPVVAIAFIGGYLMIRESKGERLSKPDILGVILSIGGLSTLVYGIIEAGRTSWADGTVLVCLGVAAIILGLFLWWEKRSNTPMLPMDFFRNMSFTGGSLAMLMTVFSLMGSLFFISQYLQSVQGYSPVASAVRMLPMGITIFIFAVMSAWIAHRIGNKFAVALGTLITGVGLLYFALVLAPDSSYALLVVGMLLIGCGMGVMVGPATDAIQGSLPVGRAGIASAMNPTTQQVGAALGVAVLGALMNATYLDKIDALAVVTSLPAEAAEAVRDSIQGAHFVAAQLPADASQAVVDGANSAFTSGMTDAMFIGAIVMFVCAVLTFVILPKRVKVLAEHTEPSPETKPDLDHVPVPRDAGLG
jgi:EmrB/QacA subfamily drug resistance transporter